MDKSEKYKIDENQRMLNGLLSYIIAFGILIPSLLLAMLFETDFPLIIGIFALIIIQLISGYSGLTHLGGVTHKKEKPKLYWSTITIQVIVLAIIIITSVNQ